MKYYLIISTIVVVKNRKVPHIYQEHKRANDLERTPFMTYRMTITIMIVLILTTIMIMIVVLNMTYKR